MASIYKIKSLVATLSLIILIIGYNFKQEIKQYLINAHIVDLIATLKNFGELTVGKEEVIAKLKYKNIPLVVNKLDRCVCLNIRIRGEWEHQFANKIISLVNDGDSIVEIGANYGVYTIPFLDAVGKNGNLYAYEANPLIYKSLVKSYVLNEFKIDKLYNLAVSNYTGKSTINYSYQNLGGGMITKKSQEINDNYLVDTVILDEHLNKVDSVNMIKIDAEGSEINIIPSAEKILDRSPRLLLVMEWSPSQMSRYNQDIFGFVQFLMSKNFNILEFNLDGSISRLQQKDLLMNKHRELLLYKPASEQYLISKIGKYIK